MENKTINRGWLLRQAKAGNLLAIGSYNFTEGINDRQGGDRQENIEIPVRIKTSHDDFKEGFYNLIEFDFKSKSGCAYRDDNNVIHLVVHSNCNYDFKIKEGGK